MAIPIPNQHEIRDLLANALGVDPDGIYRIVLDVRTDAPVIAYIQMYVTNRILEFDWDALANARVKILDKES